MQALSQLSYSPIRRRFRFRKRPFSFRFQAPPVWVPARRGGIYSAFPRRSRGFSRSGDFSVIFLQNWRISKNFEGLVPGCSALPQKERPAGARQPALIVAETKRELSALPRRRHRRSDRTCRRRLRPLPRGTRRLPASRPRYLDPRYRARRRRRHPRHLQG